MTTQAELTALAAESDAEHKKTQAALKAIWAIVPAGTSMEQAEAMVDAIHLGTFRPGPEPSEVLAEYRDRIKAA